MNRFLDDMVERQIARRGIRDEKLLAALRRVDRAAFIPEPHTRFAYDDGPQPIGYGQTISQPFIVALMAEMLEVKSGERILEVGVGCGYQAAILMELGATVFGLERIHELSARARANLIGTYRGRFHIVSCDGTLGFPLRRTLSDNFFDACIVAAAAPHIPAQLIRQLKPRGRLVIPVGERHVQELLLIRKRVDGSVEKIHGEGVRFVPLIGKDGYR